MLKEKDLRNCAYCNNTFIQGRNGARSKYCSDKCANQASIERQRNKKEQDLKNGVINGCTLPEYIFKRYKSQAKRKEREFTLELSVFQQYWQSNCYYCGDKMQMVGFDRVDSKKGYTLENIVPCCTQCNLMKRHLSPETFLDICRRISGYCTLSKTV